MKKFYFFICIMMFVSLMLVSCIDNTYNIAKENISEIRYNLLDFYDDDMSVTFMSGERESDYSMNGTQSELVDFAIIKLNFTDKNYGYNERTVTYKAVINEIEYSGEMLNNPYDNSFVVDLNIDARDLDNLDITFSIDNNEKHVELSKANIGWKYDGLNALKIVCNDMKEYIKQFINNNKLDAECYIKIVNNTDNKGEYYWYVQIYATNGTTISEIINPLTGEILAKSIK
ncbi:MAG: hypothetical protein E7361_00955 [Clostridiales bacterium]|nr:hypothetical protein [Clostridiales bacterium]